MKSEETWQQTNRLKVVGGSYHSANVYRDKYEREVSQMPSMCFRIKHCLWPNLFETGNKEMEISEWTSSLSGINKINIVPNWTANT